jgi:hypothetical protein
MNASPLGQPSHRRASVLHGRDQKRLVVALGRGLRTVDGLKGLCKGGVALRTNHPNAERFGSFKAEPVVRYIRECLG